MKESAKCRSNNNDNIIGNYTYENQNDEVGEQSRSFFEVAARYDLARDPFGDEIGTVSDWFDKRYLFFLLHALLQRRWHDLAEHLVIDERHLPRQFSQVNVEYSQQLGAGQFWNAGLGGQRQVFFHRLVLFESYTRVTSMDAEIVGVQILLLIVRW